jgi:hypothetical protein
LRTGDFWPERVLSFYDDGLVDQLQHPGTMLAQPELWHYAKVCRVLNVMRPYFDSLA